MNVGCDSSVYTENESETNLNACVSESTNADASIRGYEI